MQTLGHCASCFILQSRRVETSDWSLTGRMHMPFERATKPCQALQNWEDAGTTQTVEGKKKKTTFPSLSMSGAQEAEENMKLSGQTQRAVYVLVSIMLQVTLCSSSSVACCSGKASWGYPGQSKRLCLRMLCQPCSQPPPGKIRCDGGWSQPAPSLPGRSEARHKSQQPWGTPNLHWAYGCPLHGPGHRVYRQFRVLWSCPPSPRGCLQKVGFGQQRGDFRQERLLQTRRGLLFS